MAIYTDREFQKWASWHVVYEWEDIFSDALNIELKSIKSFSLKQRLIRKLAREFNKYASIKFNKESYGLYFAMAVNSIAGITNQSIIPIYLDVHLNDIEAIIKQIKKCPLFFVTNYEIYKILKRKYKLNVYYISLSVSNKHITHIDISNKSVDIIQIGRANPVLHQYAMKYTQQNPHIDYVYQTFGGSLTYTSTLIKDKKLLCSDRNSFMKLLRTSKISLVSSPAMDKVRDFGENIDFFTPRFFESAIARCHMLGRYTQNEECELLKIKNVCANIFSYEDFKQRCNQILGNYEIPQSKAYNEFIENNVTSKRAQFVKEALAKNE
jgi:hypothetical protein